ncbi:MAG: hypothetical protein ACT4R6_12815 [Gemmatimonadaceae bacterium]
MQSQCGVELRLTIAASLLFSACSLPSRGDLEMTQSLNDLGDALSTMQQDYGVLAAQVDSLHGVVAKQDSLLRTLANLAGVAPPR